MAVGAASRAGDGRVLLVPLPQWLTVLNKTSLDLPVRLLRLIEILEDCLGRKAEKRFLPMQPGDVPATYADIDDLKRDFGFDPSTRVEVGVERFVRWYRDFYDGESPARQMT